MISIPIPSDRTAPTAQTSAGMRLRVILLVCGVLSSLLYAFMNVFVAMQAREYSSMARTVSELSAIDAPTRPLWVSLAIVYSVLWLAFGFGVWAEGRSRGKRPLFVAGSLIVAHAVVGLFWPPMHQREVLAAGGGTLTDTLHIVWTIVTALFMMSAIGFAAAAFGKRFRLYSILTIVASMAFGVWTGMQSPAMEANLPTPWIGLVERISIAAFMLWAVVFAIALLRTRAPGSPDNVVRPLVRPFVKTHPVASYFALAFAISWSAALLVIGGPGGIPATPADAQRLLPYTVLAMLAGPSIAGIVLTGLVNGTAGVRALFSRLLKWRVSRRWYAVALLAGPVLAIAALFALLPTSPEFLPGIFATENKLSLLWISVAAGLSAGVLEEIGWTGFAVPMLRKRYAVISTGLIVGLTWGAWHFLAAFWGSGTESGAFSVSLFLAQVLFYVAVLPAFRVLMVWVYDHTESLLLSMLMHASLTGSVLFVLMPLTISAAHLMGWYFVLAVELWVVVAGLALAKRGELTPPLRHRAV